MSCIVKYCRNSLKSLLFDAFYIALLQWKFVLFSLCHLPPFRSNNLYLLTVCVWHFLRFLGWFLQIICSINDSRFNNVFFPFCKIYHCSFFLYISNCLCLYHFPDHLMLFFPIFVFLSDWFCIPTTSTGIANENPFFSLDEAIASGAVNVIVFESAGRVGGNCFGARWITGKR